MILQARPQLENFAVGREYFWTPLSAAQADASWRIGGRLELSLGARLELAMPREVDRTTTFCSFACGNETDTWKLGGPHARPGRRRPLPGLVMRRGLGGALAATAFLAVTACGGTSAPDHGARRRRR